MYHILVLIILILIFLKNKWNSSLIFCDNIKNKSVINICFKIIKQLRDEVFSFIDEFEDDDFIFANDFTRFRFIKNDNVIDYDDNDEDDDSLASFKFKTDDNLLYNRKINIPVCVISLSSVIKKKETLIIQYLDYKNVFMKMKDLKTYKLFLYKYKR